VERGGEWVEKERRSMAMMGAKSSGKHTTTTPYTYSPSPLSRLAWRGGCSPTAPLSTSCSPIAAQNEPL